MTYLDGKVAIVTGSTQGLGLGIAKALARVGAAVVINGRSQARAEAVCAEIADCGRLVAIGADLSREEAAQALIGRTVEALGSVDILVNNAQFIPPYARIESDGRNAAFAETMASGLYASLWTARAAFPFMQARHWGRIVNFGSINATFGARFSGHYNATKQAIQGLTRTLANEWGQHGITVNMVLPAGLSPSFVQFHEADPKRAEAMRKMHPMRRHGRPEEDIGAAIRGLVSDHAGYITGQTFYLDGGNGLLGLPQFNQVEEGA